MKKSEIKNKVFLLGFLLVSNCCEGPKKIPEGISAEIWESTTMKFIKQSCKTTGFDSSLIPTVSFDGKTFDTIEGQIRYRISIRKSLLSFLKSSKMPLNRTELRIVELYHDNPVFVIKSADGKYYSIKFKGYTDNEKPTVKLTQSYSEWFNTSSCSNGLKHGVCVGLSISTIVNSDGLGGFNYRHCQVSVF